MFLRIFYRILLCAFAPLREPLTSQLKLLLLGLFLLASLGCAEHTDNATRALRLATTTSTHDSGLLAEILPPFERQHAVRVDVIAVGTGKALKLGEQGDVDVVLVHARQAEDAFLAAGHGIRREAIMSNTFELLGPPDDPANIQGMQVSAALQQIAAGNFRFVSRGDDSGTHKRELLLWEKNGGLQNWKEYLDTGQGMGPTLIVADQMKAYVLADRGTYLRFKSKVDLVPLAAPSSNLQNPYGIIVVNPDKYPAMQSEWAHALVDYMISPPVQQAIANFQVEEESLFVPLQLP